MKLKDDRRRSKTLEFNIVETSKPWIPEGDYSVAFERLKPGNYYGTEKIYVHFKVVDQGPFFETPLTKIYNYYDPLPRGCDLYKDLCLLHGKRFVKKLSLSDDLFKKGILRVRVRTVKIDKKQIPLADVLQYSVIDSILGLATGVTNG